MLSVLSPYMLDINVNGATIDVVIITISAQDKLDTLLNLEYPSTWIVGLLSVVVALAHKQFNPYTSLLAACQCGYYVYRRIYNF